MREQLGGKPGSGDWEILQGNSTSCNSDMKAPRDIGKKILEPEVKIWNIQISQVKTFLIRSQKYNLNKLCDIYVFLWFLGQVISRMFQVSNLLNKIVLSAANTMMCSI